MARPPKEASASDIDHLEVIGSPNQTTKSLENSFKSKSLSKKKTIQKAESQSKFQNEAFEKYLFANFRFNKSTGRLNKVWNCRACNKEYKIRCNAKKHAMRHLKDEITGKSD